ncbi:MAG: RluA family pseudouridine synthase [Firmicutes bacterium]|nr:RluA family pseudouridine synthase [Bacillota bacterium]
MTGQRIAFDIPPEMDGIRLDRAMAETMSGVSRSYLQKLIKGGAVTVNGEVCTEKKAAAAGGDRVEVLMPEPQRLNVEGQDIPLDIVYEDEDLLVVDKPAGMVVHPAPGSPEGTLVNALLYARRDQLSSINGVLRPGIVHRIDKDTSGLLVVAKSNAAHESLSRQLAEHSITRVYHAIVLDNLKEDEGTIDRPIGRDPKNRLRNAVVERGGRPAVTHFRVLERFGRYTYIEAKLETGRTHQIRVHMSWIRHPLLGDTLYGPQKNSAGAHRQMLHARTLGFVHPATGEYMEWESPLPEDFRKVLEGLRRKA